MQSADLFLYMLHFKKSLTSRLGKDKSSALRVYERAFYAPTINLTYNNKSNDSVSHTEYLGSFLIRITGFYTSDSRTALLPAKVPIQRCHS